MTKKQERPHGKIRFIFLVASFLVLAPVAGNSTTELKETVDTKIEQEVYLFKGDLVALKVYSLTRIAISNPEIIDVANADVNEVLIIGQKVGTTQIFNFWIT